MRIKYNAALLLTRDIAGYVIIRCLGLDERHFFMRLNGCEIVTDVYVLRSKCLHCYRLRLSTFQSLPKRYTAPACFNCRWCFLQWYFYEVINRFRPGISDVWRISKDIIRKQDESKTTLQTTLTINVIDKQTSTSFCQHTRFTVHQSHALVIQPFSAFIRQRNNFLATYPCILGTEGYRTMDN